MPLSKLVVEAIGNYKALARGPESTTKSSNAAVDIRVKVRVAQLRLAM